MISSRTRTAACSSNPTPGPSPALPSTAHTLLPKHSPLLTDTDQRKETGCLSPLKTHLNLSAPVLAPDSLNKLSGQLPSKCFYFPPITSRTEATVSSVDPWPSVSLRKTFPFFYHYSYAFLTSHEKC